METKFSKSWEEFKNSKDGKSALNLETLKNLTDPKYLENRLNTAFSAGFNANTQVDAVVKGDDSKADVCEWVANDKTLNWDTGCKKEVEDNDTSWNDLYCRHCGRPIVIDGKNNLDKIEGE